MSESSYHVETSVRLEDLDQYGTLHSFCHKWSPRPGEHSTVSGGYFTSKEAAEFVRNSALADRGYTAPRWWQWWRWGEYRIDR